MKKSKVIIPAAALLLFSTAASVTGTVAWFTANRVFNTSAGNFSIARLDGDLDVVLADGQGTTQVGEKGTSSYAIAVNANTKLIDGSFNHKRSGDGSKHAFRKNRDTTGYQDFGLEGPGWIYRTVNSVDYWVALSWKMRFMYTFNAESTNVGVYLNLAESSFERDSDVANEATKKGIKGFRIAFVSHDDSFVWGDKADSTSQVDGHWTYVKTTTTTDQYVLSDSGANPAISEGDFIPVSGSRTASANYMNGEPAAYSSAADAAGQTGRDDRVCTLVSGQTDGAAGTTGIGQVTVTCVAWFEGTDPNVEDGTVMDIVNASMSFYARSDGPLTA